MDPQSEHEKYINIAPEIFKDLLQKGAVILDVRTDKEVTHGIIEGAIANFDIYEPDFETKIDALDRNKTYLVYCRSGVRSAHACEMMAAMGFKSLYNLRGGIIAWINAGN